MIKINRDLPIYFFYHCPFLTFLFCTPTKSGEPPVLSLTQWISVRVWSCTLVHPVMFIKTVSALVFIFVCPKHPLYLQHTSCPYLVDYIKILSILISCAIDDIFCSMRNYERVTLFVFYRWGGWKPVRLVTQATVFYKSESAFSWVCTQIWF